MPHDNQSELFYLVDENDNVLGSIPRHAAHTDKNKIHRAIAIFVINEQNEMLLQQRSRYKDMDPGFWMYGVGGHVTYDDDYDHTAERELQEELGISSTLKFLHKRLKPAPQQIEYMSFYEARVPSNTHFSPDSTEVERIEWVKIPDLPGFWKSHPMQPWVKEDFIHAGYLLPSVL